MSKLLRPHRAILPLALVVLLSILRVTVRPASAQAQGESKQANSIYGVVVNSVTREPIGRALVLSLDNRFATMTDGEGRFEFKFAQAGTEKNQADKSGSENTSTTTSICEGGTCTTYSGSSQGPDRPNMLIAKKPGFLSDQHGLLNPEPVIPGKELTIGLTPEALVVGRVTLPSSEPSDAIQLEIYRRQVREGLARWLSAGSASTKSTGEFRFAELAAGTYKLLTRELQDRDPLTFDPHGQLYGYAPVYFPSAGDFGGAGTIQLVAGQIFQADISLVRHPYYPVKVAVTNAPTGSGIRVVVSAQGNKGPGYSLGYNDDDQMIEGTLPNGSYTLEASTFGREAMAGLLNISVQGAAVEGPRMTLASAGSIRVNVKEEFTTSKDTDSPNGTIYAGQQRGNERGPRRYLNISLEPADDFVEERGAFLRPPSGPGDDSLAIDNVPPGRYWVRANSSRGFVASITSGETDLLHQPLVVGLGGSSSPIEITMRDDAGEIDGTIEGAATPSNVSAGLPNGFGSGAAAVSAPASSTHLYCVPLPDSTGEYRDIWVGPDGNFGPQQLPPGTYRVLAFNRPQPELEYRDPEAMRAYDAKGELIRLVAGQKEHLHLQLISNSE
jgi:hypothetical protein